MMGPAAATQTPSAYVLEESVWYVFTLVAFEKMWFILLSVMLVALH